MNPIQELIQKYGREIVECLIDAYVFNMRNVDKEHLRKLLIKQGIIKASTKVLRVSINENNIFKLDERGRYIRSATGGLQSFGKKIHFVVRNGTGKWLVEFRINEEEISQVYKLED